MKKPTKLPELKPLPWAADEAGVANKYLNEKCGTLHLGWVLDHYWGLVTQKMILPAALKIHAALVEKGHSEKNSLMWGDADGDIFFIPSKDKKVFVHTTQSRDFLYIINNRSEFGDDGDCSFHIRRIYRAFKEDRCYTSKELIGSMKLARQHADTLSEYHDDDYRYSHRPSLEAYRKVDFQIPYHPKDREKERDYYGDFRDGGYILSYDGWQARRVHPRVEGSKYVFTELETLATCYISSMACDLEIDIPHLDGYP